MNLFVFVSWDAPGLDSRIGQVPLMLLDEAKILR